MKFDSSNNQINLMKFIKTRDNFDQVKVQGYIVLLEVQGVINTGARGSRDKLSKIPVTVMR